MGGKLVIDGPLIVHGRAEELTIMRAEEWVPSVRLRWNAGVLEQEWLETWTRERKWLEVPHADDEAKSE